MYLKYKYFLLGYLFCIGMKIFEQGMMGLEKYIAHIRAGWVEPSPVCGFLLMVITIVLAVSKKSS